MRLQLTNAKIEIHLANHIDDFFEQISYKEYLTAFELLTYVKKI